jgi:hypothetical protein
MAASPLPQDKLDKLREAVALVRNLELEISDQSNSLAELNARLSRIVNKDLPLLFSEAKTQSIELAAEGNAPAYEARLVPYYSATIADSWELERKEKAFKWLTVQGHGAVIKNTVTVYLPLGANATCKKVVSALRKIKLPKAKGVKKADPLEFSVKKSVPHSTLTALVKDLIENHKQTPPMETLGASTGMTVKITRAKEPRAVRAPKKEKAK